MGNSVYNSSYVNFDDGQFNDWDRMDAGTDETESFIE